MKELKLNKRHIKEINYLLSSNTRTTTQELSRVLSVKQRTLKEDLKVISSFLSDYNVYLIKQPHVGVYLQNLTDDQKKAINTALKNFDTEETKPDRSERFREILFEFLILDNIPTVENLAAEFNVSSFTVSQDLKKIKQWLKERGISLDGLGGRGRKIEAKEEDIRKAILDALDLDQSADYRYEIFKLFMINLKYQSNINFTKLQFPELVRDIEKVMHDIEENTKTKIAEEDQRKLFYSIMISFLRTISNHFISIDEEQLNKFKKIKEFNAIYDSLYVFYEKYRIEKRVSEDAAFVTLTFIGLKINSFDVATGTLSGDIEETYKAYTDLVVDFIKEIFFPSLNLDSEFQNMFALHLQRTFKKIELGAKFDNPLLQKIKNEYTFEFSIADKVSRLLEKKFNIKLPETEKGFIAVYIKMALEKNRSKKKVIILCPSGLVTSNLIFFRLKNEMPELDIVLVSSLKDFREMKDNYSADLIVSTVPLSDCNIPSVVVSPLLTQEDKSLIKENLQARNEGKVSKAQRDKLLINPDIIFANIDFSNSTELLLYLGDKLFEAGYVKEGYPKKLLENEKKFPTGLPTPVPIAIPHAEQKFSLKNGILVATLKNPVVFREMGNYDKKLEVRIVLIPVFYTDVEKNVEFFDNLLKKLSDSKLANKILQANTKEELYNIIA